MGRDKEGAGGRRGSGKEGKSKPQVQAEPKTKTIRRRRHPNGGGKRR
jgi:hypothetical protein